jgi:hypothetical protein
MRRRSVALALLVLLAGTIRAEEPRPGRIVGSVRLVAPVPARRAIDVTVDLSACGTEIPDESLLVAAHGGVANAVVIVRDVGGGGPGARPEALIDNVHCRFVPRVQVVTRGQTVRVRSSDPILHNTHPVLVADPEVYVANVALVMPGQTMDLTRRLAEKLPAAGEVLVRLGCDVHPWMRGWLVVVDHRYAAVTAGDGTFAIADVPPGAYTLALWHETLGRSERRVTVPPGGSATVDFELRSDR